ncbi:MAG: hypothetical protein OXU81_17235, partial [Gammaproteobacteria bacterium]|nr:hypothetical protein [Gammaproteobacteria bacterium]
MVVPRRRQRRRVRVLPGQMTITLNLPELGDSSESRLVSIVVPADSERTDGTVRAAQKQLRAKLYRIVVVPDQSLAGQPLENL